MRRMRIITSILFVSLAGVLGACSSQQLYATGQQWQKQQCGRHADSDERTRCEKNAAGMSYDTYKAGSDTAKSR
jgi:hypothetical protein